MIAMFGATAFSLAKLWELMEDHGFQDDWPRGVHKKHLCWAMHKLKVYLEESVMCTTVNGGRESEGRPG